MFNGNFLKNCVKFLYLMKVYSMKLIFPLLSILFFSFCSCSSTKKEFMKFDKNDYLAENDLSYIKVSYSFIREVDKSSDYKMVIKNNDKKNLNLFSTVIENSNMFYSNKNYKIEKSKLQFNTFYSHYMNDAEHSGIKKFNFIVIKPNDSLIINIDKNFIKKETAEIDLNYLFFYSNEQINLIDVNKLKLKNKNIRLKRVILF